MELTRYENTLLTKSFTSDKMKSEAMLEIICTLKIEDVKEKHPYDITPPNPNSKDQRWSSYIYDPECKNNRRKIRGNSEKELILKISKICFDDKKVHTLESNFEDWLIYRKSKNLSDLTIDRYRNYWNKYYEGEEISEKPLHNITAEDIEDFLHKCISKFKITDTELTNMSIILSDGLKFAKRKKLVTSNPFYDSEINRDSCSPSKHKTLPDKYRVFFMDEKEDFTRELNSYSKKNPNNTQCHGIALLFSLGLRIGELIALTWDKIDLKLSVVYINCMATKEKDENSKYRTVVVDHCKSGQDHSIRTLPLSENDLEIFRQIKSINDQNGFKSGNFIFCDQKGWMSCRRIDNRIRYLCTKAGLPVEKSSHDIRRTVASELYANGVDIEIIRDFLGHQDVKTTREYIYDFNKVEKHKKVILDGKSGLKWTQNNKKQKTLKPL